MKLSSRTRARILAAVVALMGLLNASSSAFFGLTRRLQWLRRVLPPAVTSGSRSLNLVAGFLLIAVAWNLSQRKQLAWVVACWLLAISALSHLLKGLDVEEAAVALVLLGVLAVFRRDFTVRSDPSAVQSVLFAAPFVIVFFWVYGLVGFYLLRGQFRPAFDVDGTVADLIRLATFQGEQFYTPLTHRARWFVESVTLLAGIGMVYLMVNLMRPVLRAPHSSLGERRLASLLVRDCGASSVAYFALGADKQYAFNEAGNCVIPFVLQRGVALAAGGVIGPEEDRAEAVRTFCAMCEENHWAPAFVMLEEPELGDYRASGLDTVKIGEEALLDLATYDLKGKGKQDLRTAMNRAQREGWKLQLFDGEVTDEALAAQIRELSEEWLRDKVGGEMGFVMGGSPITGSKDTLVTTVTDSTGKLMAFVTWVPMFAAKGWADDYIRRAEDAPHGAVEFAVVGTLEKLKERGDKVVSLGLAPLANVASENQEAVLSLERGLEIIYERFAGPFHYRTLKQFKDKFEPRWENRYLAYPGIAALPRVVLALAVAQMPGFGLAELGKAVRGGSGEAA